MAKKEKVYGTHLKVSTKRAGHKIGGTVGIFVFLLVLALFMALPIYLAVVMSLKPVQELFVFPPKLYVIDPTLSNYSAMFRLCSDLWVPFSRYVFNSIFVTVSVTVCQVIFSAMAAFCLAKVRFPGAKAINAIIVVALLYQSGRQQEQQVKLPMPFDVDPCVVQLAFCCQHSRFRRGRLCFHESFSSFLICLPLDLRFTFAPLNFTFFALIVQM